MEAITQEKRNVGSLVREIVFGMEDGMVSTLGSITGIAIGSQDHYIVILAGCVIISVESISMGIGSYLSNRSEQDIDDARVHDEKKQIADRPEYEEEEMKAFFVRDGWPQELSAQMASAAATNPELMLTEMKYRELGITHMQQAVNPVHNAAAMFFAYIVGGLIPLFAYFILPVSYAMPISIVITLFGLFVLGGATTRFTKQSIWKAGLRMLVLGGLALAVGLLVGQFATVLQ